MLRALYEGVVFGHLCHIEKLRAAGAQIKAVRLTGGGSRSQVWTQMFADTIQLPMEVSDGIQNRTTDLMSGLALIHSSTP